MRRRTADCCLLGYFVGFGFDFDLMKHLRRYCPWVSGSGSYLGVMYSPSYDLRYYRLLFGHSFDLFLQSQVWLV